MGTGSLQFGPGNAEIIGFKDFKFALKMYVSKYMVTWKNGIVLTHYRVNQE